jgi:anti-sigma regulatory factor (Ser/Thr protein kinase)
MSLSALKVSPEGGMRSGFRMAMEGQLSEVGRFAAAFADFASERQVPTEVRRSLQVVLDDLLANVVLYGLAGRAGGEAIVDVALAGDAVVITVSDNGPPFDPFARAAPDTTLGIEGREIGGLGIHLVRQMMDEVSYQRREDRNVTVLKKRLHDGTSHSESGGK